MDISLAVGTYYLKITPAEVTSGAIGTGYRLLVTGHSNAGSISPGPGGNPPPGGTTPPRPPYDAGSNNRQFPTFIGSPFIGRLDRSDSIGGGDSDDWYSIDVSYTRRDARYNHISIRLTGTATAGIELYRPNGTAPFDKRPMPGKTNDFDLWLDSREGKYLIHIIPLASPSPAISYTLTVQDLNTGR